MKDFEIDIHKLNMVVEYQSSNMKRKKVELWGKKFDFEVKVLFRSKSSNIFSTIITYHLPGNKSKNRTRRKMWVGGSKERELVSRRKKEREREVMHVLVCASVVEPAEWVPRPLNGKEGEGEHGPAARYGGLVLSLSLHSRSSFLKWFKIPSINCHFIIC